MRTAAEPVEVEVSPRDVCCNRFQARVRVGGRVAVRYVYRLRGDLTPYAVTRMATIKDIRAFSRIFGRRAVSKTMAPALLRTFLEREARELHAQSDPVHVRSAAASKQFARIPNRLAVEHALLILPHIEDDELWRRLDWFLVCDEAGTVAPFHWTTQPEEWREGLPPEVAM